MLHLAILLAAQLAGDALPQGTYDGQCLYPDAVRAFGTELATCNRAIIAEGGIAFLTRGTSQQIQFRGHWDGERLTVEEVVLRGRSPAQARGFCQLYRANERLSTVTCTALSRNRSFAANFVRSSVNDPL